jgi:DNA-binding FrmR family transcriptional regulator
MKVLRRHIDTCVTEAIKDDGETKNEMIEELMAILSRQEL